MYTEQAVSLRFGVVPFRYLWLGLAVSAAGDHLHRVALNWTVTNEGGVSSAATLGALTVLPLAVLGLAGGVIADRVSRTRLMVATDLARAALSALAALVALTAPAVVAPYFAVALLLATGSALFFPAMQALLPDVVGGDRDRIVDADAKILSTVTALKVLGPAAAGLLIAHVPLPLLFAADSLSYVFCAAMVWLMMRELPAAVSRPVRRRRPGGKGILSEATEGIRLLLRDPALRPQFLVFPLLDAAFFAIPFLLPAYLQEGGAGTASWYGALLAALALGRILGSAAMTRTGLKNRRGRLLAVNYLAQGVALALFALTFRHLPLVGVAALVLSGIPSGAAQVAVTSYVQLAMPPEVRGRTFAGMAALTTSLTPLGIPALGAVAAWGGPELGVAAVAAVFCLGGAFVACHRAVWRMR